MKLGKRIIVYKGAKAKVYGQLVPVLVTLELPKGVDIRIAIGSMGQHKNRASRAKVISIESPGGLVRYDAATSRGGFVYRVGKVAKPDSWTKDPKEKCGHGIHFYLRRREALQWVGVYQKSDPQVEQNTDEMTKLKSEVERWKRAYTMAQQKVNNAKVALA